MKRLRANLTYANVVSTLCLILLLGGGAAFAAEKLAKNSVGTAQIKKNAVTGPKIKKEAITAAKIKKGTLTGAQIDVAKLGQVPSAASAGTAVTATSAATASRADTAAFAESANPEAFAFVEENGSVLAVRSKGIASANVKHPSTGTYCITVPGFTPTGGQVTTEFLGFPSQSATLTIGGTGFCPAPAVQVTTTKISTVAVGPADIPFQIALYR